MTGYAEAVPDLVVESLRRPSDGRWALNDKAFMWLSYGVRLVWVVHSDQRTVDVHRTSRPIATVNDADTLDGLDTLPGFRCRVGEIFER